MLNKVFKPKMFYLCFLMFGLSLSSTFLLSNLSSLFKFLGANDASLPLLWIITPLTGLIIQPLMGQISDDTSTPFGKRRPFIIVWSLIATICFALLVNNQSLAIAILLILLIECSINGAVEALRALTGDMTSSNQDRYKIFALQAFFSGVGGSIGASLPFLIEKIFNYFHVSHTILPNEIPSNLRYAFVFTTVVLVLTIYVCMVHVKEKPTRVSLLNKKKKPSSIKSKLKKFSVDMYINIKKMPKQFRRVFLINGLTWGGIFAFWLYFTLCLAQNIYHLPVNADMVTHQGNIATFHQANITASFYFAIYQYVSIGYALFLYFLSKSEKIKLIHAVSLIIGGLSLCIISFATSHATLIMAFVGVGILWGSILVLPYAIIMQVMPKGKLGVYLGIFNISITAPQIIAGVILAPLFTHFFKGQADQIMLLAGGMILFSGLLWLRLHREETPAAHPSLKEAVK